MTTTTPGGALQALMADLKVLTDLESPSTDPAAIQRVMDVVEGWARDLGAETHALGGGTRVFRFGVRPGAADRPVLILTHADTVWPHGTLEDMPWRVDGDRLHGPGTYDMKAGIVGLFHALRALDGQWPRGGVTVLLSPDEEIGSPSTRMLIESEAQRNRYVLVPEPARRDGGVVTGRYAIARYRLTATGRPSHAGLRLGEGVSAISEIAHQVGVVEGMTNDDCTFSVGVLSGGQWVNCVATTASIEILNMSKTEALLADGRQRLAALTPRRPEATLALEHGVCRPLWTTTEKDLALYETARLIAQDLGFEIPNQYSAGGSDGNFTGALGVPTLDGLGPRGEGPHTLDEHIVISSLAERGRLIAGLLACLT